MYLKYGIKTNIQYIQYIQNHSRLVIFIFYVMVHSRSLDVCFHVLWYTLDTFESVIIWINEHQFIDLKFTGESSRDYIRSLFTSDQIVSSLARLMRDIGDLLSMNWLVYLINSLRVHSIDRRYMYTIHFPLRIVYCCGEKVGFIIEYCLSAFISLG